MERMMIIGEITPEITKDFLENAEVNSELCAKEEVLFSGHEDYDSGFTKALAWIGGGMDNTERFIIDEAIGTGNVRSLSQLCSILESWDEGSIAEKINREPDDPVTAALRKTVCKIHDIVCKKNGPASVDVVTLSRCGDLLNYLSMAYRYGGIVLIYDKVPKDSIQVKQGFKRLLPLTSKLIVPWHMKKNMEDIKQLLQSSWIPYAIKYKKGQYVVINLLD